MHIRVFFIGQLSYGYDAQLILVCINDIALGGSMLSRLQLISF